MPKHYNDILPGGTGPGFTRVTRNNPKVRVRMPNGEVREMSRDEAELMRNAMRFNSFVNAQRPEHFPNDPVPVNRDLALPDFGRVIIKAPEGSEFTRPREGRVPRIGTGTEIAPGGERLIPPTPSQQPRMLDPLSQRIQAPGQLPPEFIQAENDAFIKAQTSPRFVAASHGPESREDRAATLRGIRENTIRERIPLAPEDQKALDDLERMAERDRYGPWSAALDDFINIKALFPESR